MIFLKYIEQIPHTLFRGCTQVISHKNMQRKIFLAFGAVVSVEVVEEEEEMMKQLLATSVSLNICIK